MSADLVLYDDMRRAVAECHTTDEAKNIRDKATAMAVYARQIHDKAMWTWCAEIRFRAMRRIGQLDDERPRTGRGNKVVVTEDDINRDERWKARLMASISDDEYEAILDQLSADVERYTARTILNIIQRREAHAALVKGDGLPPSAPGKRYSILLADPPWRYDNAASKGAAASEYSTISLEGLCTVWAAHVAKIRMPDAAIFLWATVPMLPEALQVMEAWGFDYKSHLVWDKGAGMGNWFRVGHELLLFGITGDFPTPDTDRRIGSVVAAPRGAHSAKPEIFYEIIERMYPGVESYELFHRGPVRDGWQAEGLEIAG